MFIYICLLYYNGTNVERIKAINYYKQRNKIRGESFVSLLFEKSKLNKNNLIYGNFSLYIN